MGESNGPANSLASAEPVPCSAGSQDQLPNHAAILKLKAVVIHHLLTLRGEQRSPAALRVVLGGWGAGSRVRLGWIFGAAGNWSGDAHCCVWVRAVCLSRTPTSPFFSFPFSAQWC